MIKPLDKINFLAGKQINNLASKYQLEQYIVEFSSKIASEGVYEDDGECFVVTKSINKGHREKAEKFAFSSPVSLGSSKAS